MATWQLVVVTALLLLPFSLLTSFWPHRERFTVAGKPVERPWRPRVTQPEPDEHH